MQKSRAQIPHSVFKIIPILLFWTFKVESQLTKDVEFEVEVKGTISKESSFCPLPFCRAASQSDTNGTQMKITWRQVVLF